MRFLLDQVDADEFSLEISEEGNGATWRVTGMSTSEAVALFEAVEAGIGSYVREMRQAKREFDAGIVPPMVNVAAADNMDSPFNDDSGYELMDPKHPTYRDRMAGFHDDRDKTAGAS